MDIKKLIQDRVAAVIEGVYVDMRHAILAELAGEIAARTQAKPVPVSSPPEITPVRNPNQSKIRVRIARLCQNQSKGPRFRYLCEEHLGASKKQIKEWKALGASV